MECFNTLGLDSSCTEDDVKKRFRQLALIWHPDHNKSANANKKYIELENAKDNALKAISNRSSTSYAKDPYRPPRPNTNRHATYPNPRPSKSTSKDKKSIHKKIIDWFSGKDVENDYLKYIDNTEYYSDRKKKNSNKQEHASGMGWDY